jgi:hypothetical protein
MNISNDIFTSVTKYLNKVISNNNDEINFEFEAIILNPTEKEFINVFNSLNNNTSHYTNISLDSTKSNETLDITCRAKRDHRITINSKNNIINYCKDNICKGKISEIILKKKIDDYNSFICNSYNIKFNLKSEEKIIDSNEINEIASIFDKNTKYFRYKKRYSFLSKSELFRIDLTIVKSSNIANSFKFINAGVNNNIEMYEIEIEYLDINNKNKADNAENTKKIGIELFKIIAHILSKVQDSDFLMTLQEKTEVSQTFINLINNNKKSGSTKTNIGPKPKTLEQYNILSEPPLGIISIVKDYTVTDKADGERNLLYVHTNNKIYLIEDALHLSIVNTGLKHENILTIIDGEYIKKGLDNTNIKLFMCFDIYYNKNEDVSWYPLTNSAGISRLSIMEDFMSDKTFSSDLAKNKKNVGNSIIIKVKKFEEATSKKSIFKLASKILNDHKLGKTNYHIDGLIFTPAKLPVGGTSTDATKTNLFDAWPRAFKWKPAQENSIDFLVKINNTIVKINNNNYKLCYLYAGSNKTNTDFDPIEILTANFKPIYINYIPTKYTECYLLLKDDYKAYCSDNEIIIDDTIVEFTYNTESNDDNTLRWLPLRNRHDKTNKYKKTNSISNTANDLNSTVKNVWKSIINPVTVEMITGIKTLTNEIVEENDIYYSREVDRAVSLTNNMLQFHNFWIKDKCLYEKFNKLTDKSLFEIACGTGGDINKWLKYKFNPIVGTDLSLDNIMNETNGIYNRFSKLKKGISKNINMMFLRMDSSKEWTTEYINTLEDTLSKNFAETLWGVNRPSNKYFNVFYNIINKNKFNLVSCQFAIHYFFESEQILDNFINNLDLILKPGGYFFGTSLDGYLVDNKFTEKGTDIVEGFLYEKRLWRIKKEYNKFDMENPYNNIGSKILVFVETINKEFSEYLVDFQLLKLKLSQKNIELLNNKEIENLNINSAISTQTFDEVYNKVNITNINHKMNSVELREYSFLNRYFIFRKKL